MWKKFVAGVLGLAAFWGGHGLVAAAPPSPHISAQEREIVTAADREREKPPDTQDAATLEDDDNFTVAPSSPADNVPTTDADKTEVLTAPGTIEPKDAKATEPPPAKKAENKNEAPAPRKIIINLASRSLSLYEGDKKTRLYPIAPGKVNMPTPTGYYSIQAKIVNPSWTSTVTGETIASGPDNPLGYRWLEFNGHHYGIHGTNKPESIGGYASMGCVRMLEKDVEELFDLVEVGTPLEITYNRVVVEKLPDNTVTYYIYPDGYGRQPLSVDDVEEWLGGYGVAAFESRNAIADKINASDGQPTYIAKIYPIKVNGQQLKNNAVKQSDVMYLPAVEIAEHLKTGLQWQEDNRLLIAPKGKATGYVKNDLIYFNADDLSALFNIDGGLRGDGVFIIGKGLETAVTAPTAPAAPTGQQGALEG